MCRLEEPAEVMMMVRGQESLDVSACEEGQGDGGDAGGEGDGVFGFLRSLWRFVLC